MTTYCNGKPYRQGIDWFDLTALHDAVWEGEDVGGCDERYSERNKPTNKKDMI